MRPLLKIRLFEYLRNNYPDILSPLESQGEVSRYLEVKLQSVDDILIYLTLERKPKYIIEEICMNELLKEYTPSKFMYISEILSEHFEDQYYRLLAAGIVKYEIINIIEVCNPVFENYRFAKSLSNEVEFFYSILGSIQEYFENAEMALKN